MRYTFPLDKQYMDDVQRCRENAQRWETTYAPRLAEWLAKYPTRSAAYDAAIKRKYDETTPDEELDVLYHIIPALRG